MKQRIPRNYVIFSIVLLLIALISIRHGAILVSNKPTMIQHILNDQIKVLLPNSTHLSHEEHYEGSDIFYSVYLEDQELSYKGYIQLWKLKDVKAFLEKSKETSTYDFVSHSIKPFSQNHHHGFINEWTASFGKLYSISGKEYWLFHESQEQQDTTTVLRISLFIPATAFTAEQTNASDMILSTLEWN